MHSELCQLAVKWLQRPQSQGGPGCTVAVSEVRTGWSGEIPDAIGFRASGDFSDGSVVVEVKVSRADFLADAKKPHRQAGGIGTWRYYLCPEGLIQPDELPAGWGLLWVNRRGHIKPMAGPALHAKAHYQVYRDTLAAWCQPVEAARERFLLVKLFHRIGDAETLNQTLKSAYAEQARLVDRVNALQAERDEFRRELNQLRRQLWRLQQGAEEVACSVVTGQ